MTRGMAGSKQAPHIDGVKLQNGENMISNDNMAETLQQQHKYVPVILLVP